MKVSSVCVCVCSVGGDHDVCYSRTHPSLLLHLHLQVLLLSQEEAEG